MEAEFQANHAYQITAFFSPEYFLLGDCFGATLWDVTSGPATRSRVRDWVLPSEKKSSEVVSSGDS